MTTDPKQLVLAAFVELLRLADEGKVHSPYCGICQNIIDLLYIDVGDDDNVWVEACEFFDTVVTYKIWPRWPKFSGSADYPIPGDEYTYLSLRGGGHWKGEQGQLRRELLQFTIEQLNEVQHEHES